MNIYIQASRAYKGNSSPPTLHFVTEAAPDMEEQPLLHEPAIVTSLMTPSFV